jgi:hypothetical protein
MSDRESFEKWWPSVGQTIGKVAAWETWQAAQAQASEPIAAVTGWYNGRCVIAPLDRAMAIPVGMALYASPQAQGVNQQLLEAIKIAIECLGLHGDGFVDLGAMTVLQDFVAAIKAAQEGK